MVERHASVGNPVDGAGGDQRGDEQRRHPHAEAVEAEAELPGRVIRRGRAPRRRHVVVAAAVLVVCEHEQRLRPARARPQGLVGVVDELLAERDVVVGVLAVAHRRPTRLEERERGQRPRCRGGLEVLEQAEVRRVGTGDVREIRLGQRLLGVAEDAPAHSRFGERAEDRRARVRLSVVVHVPLAGARERERPVRQRLGRGGGEPVVADRVAFGERGQNRQGLRAEAAHDVVRRGARDDRPVLLGLPADRVREVLDEPLHGRGRAGRRRGARAPELVVGRLVALARVGARHEVGVRRGQGDRVDADRVAAGVRVGLVPGQSLERLAGRRHVPRVRVEIAQHVVE